MDHLHQESHVSIGPSSGEFTPGFQIEGHGKVGKEYDTEVAHMSSECKESAACFGLKLTLTDSKVGPQAVETLTQLLEMAKGVDQVAEVLNMGLSINFRHEDLHVFINVVVPPNFGPLQMLPGFDKIDLTKCDFSGKHDFKITSGADPSKFLTATVDEVIERLSNFSVEANLDFNEAHHVITTVAGLLKGILPDKPKVQMLLAGLNLFTAFRSQKFEFKYDSTVVKSVVKNTLSCMLPGEMMSEQLKGHQQFVNDGFLPQAKMMAPMFIGPYSDLLKSINLGHYEFFFMVPRLRLYLCPGFTLFGLNSFVQTNFLSE
jgi:hypothetical protein